MLWMPRWNNYLNLPAYQTVIIASLAVNCQVSSLHFKMANQNLILLLSTATVLLLGTSCSKVVSNETLEISVVDSNFAKNLAGVEVSVHESRDDAKYGSDAIKFGVTNANGITSVEVYGGDRTYWISVDNAFIEKGIKQSPAIGSGANKMAIFVHAWSDIEVYVSGTLSGNPRKNINVEFYSTEEDAKTRTKLITSGQTNAEGKVSFSRLDLGTVFWIRANATASFSIKQSHALNFGPNKLDMKLL